MNNTISKKNIIINALIMVAVLVFIFKVLIGAGEETQILNIIKHAKVHYILLGMLLAIMYIVGEGIGLKILLTIFDYNISVFKTIRYIFVGFFFSSITPSATGGQPMQIYRMTKDKIEVSHSSLCLLVQLIAYQISTFTLGFLGYMYLNGRGVIDKPIIHVLIIIGLLVDLVGVSFVLIGIFNPRVSNKILGWVTKLIGKVKFIGEEKKERMVLVLEREIGEYNRSSRYILKNKRKVFLACIISLADMTCHFGASFMVYKALNEVGLSLMEVVFFQSSTYIASYFVPIPGSMGVTESNYLNIFKHVYSPDKLKSSMVLSRGISFYFLLAVSGLVFIVDRMLLLKDLGSKKA